ncbi:MAG: CRISPR-associated endonuclease Cas2 [Clostridia bacterium]
MRVIVMFDLPMETSSNAREYRRFRKFLIKSGFIMMQQSVYSKLTLNATASNMVAENIRKNKPNDGLVQLLIVTENQYNRMEFIVGKKNYDVLENNERLIVL